MNHLAPSSAAQIDSNAAFVPVGAQEHGAGPVSPIGVTKRRPFAGVIARAKRFDLDYIGTEVAASLAMFLAKGATFHQLGVLDNRAIMQGLLICVFVLAGLLYPNDWCSNYPRSGFCS